MNQANSEQETRVRKFPCPRCDAIVEFGHYLQEPVYHCSNCYGSFYPLATLGRSLEKIGLELFSSVDPDAVLPGLPELPGNRDSLTCPLCKASMENYGYMGSNKIILDACNDCIMVWVDAHELAAMAKLRIQTDKRLTSFRNSYAPTDIVGVAMMVKAVEQAFLAGFILG